MDKGACFENTTTTKAGPQRSGKRRKKGKATINSTGVYQKKERKAKNGDRPEHNAI